MAGFIKNDKFFALLLEDKFLLFSIYNFTIRINNYCNFQFNS